MAQFRLTTRSVEVTLCEQEYLVEAESAGEAERIFRLSQGVAPQIQHLRKTVSNTAPSGPETIPLNISATTPEEMLFPALLANG